MDAEHKREIEDEERRDEREEPMRVWIEENLIVLEEEFLEALSPEDQPLDDDIPDYIDTFADDFDIFCRNKYEEVEKC